MTAAEQGTSENQIDEILEFATSERFDEREKAALR